MSSDYVDSYYKRTLADEHRHPRLEGESETEVCVIGGGFSGVSTTASGLR